MCTLRGFFREIAWFALCILIGSLAGMLTGCGGGSPEDDADQHTATIMPVVCYQTSDCAK